MKIFNCGTCGNVLFFENNHCHACGHRLGFAPDTMILTDVECVEGDEGDPAALYEAHAGESRGRRYRRCRNDVDYDSCNWLIEADDPLAYCRSCRLNEVVPNLADPEDRRAWLVLEQAKRRLLYTLQSLELPVPSRAEAPESGLAFKLLRSTPEAPVTTGHSQGLITINIAEADSVFRENMRERLGEAYRTVLGHFRHEIGHFYWDQLIAPSEDRLARFRELFGDERADYREALTRHYEQGAPEDWHDRYISAYATMHPWEDWAETWAHYFHMIDTLDTAATYGLAVQHPEPGGRRRPRRMWAVDFENFESLRQRWDALTLALNSLNRSMGLPDTYPFALCDAVDEKLRFVHSIVLEARREPGADSEAPEPKPRTNRIANGSSQRSATL